MKTILQIQIADFYTRVGDVHFAIENPTTIPQTGEIFHVKFSDFIDDHKIAKALTDSAKYDVFVAHVKSRAYTKNTSTIIIHLYPESEFKLNMHKQDVNKKMLVQAPSRQWKMSDFKMVADGVHMKNEIHQIKENFRNFERVFIGEIYRFRCYLKGERSNIQLFSLSSPKTKEHMSIHVHFVGKIIIRIIWTNSRAMDGELAKYCLNIFIQKHLVGKYSLRPNVVPVHIGRNF